MPYNYEIVWEWQKGYKAYWMDEVNRVSIGPFRATHIDAILDAKLNAIKGEGSYLMNPIVQKAQESY